MDMDNIRIAVVCSSNMNRSMEAHALLARKGFKVKSFGTGQMVRLPGVTSDQPNCYEFGVPYKDIYNDLMKKNKTFYTQNGLLQMLDRNRRVKPCPEKLQNSKGLFHIIITCEERVYDQVIDWFMSRRSVHNQPVHVINLDIKDNYKEATVGAFLISGLVTKMAQSVDLDNNIVKIVEEFIKKNNRPIINCIMFY